MNNTSGSATVKKAKTKKGVSFVARVAKVKSVDGLTKLIGRVAEFPCANPVTHRRRKRAIIARFADFGVTVKPVGSFGFAPR